MSDTQTSLPLRKDVPAAHKWHIEDIFANNDIFSETLTECKGQIQTLADYQGRLGESAQTLADYLNTKENVMVRFFSLMAYAHHRHDEDTSDPFYQDLKGQVDFVGNLFEEITAFENPELLSLPQDFLSSALKDCKDLKPFTHYLENTVRMRPHTLSKEEEALMALTTDLGSSPQSIFYMFNNADIQFESVTDANGNPVAITHGRFVPLLENPDRELRQKVFQSYYRSFKQFENTVAAIFSANLKKELFFSRARHYNSSMEAHLSVHNIPTSVYEQLIAAVHDALPDMYRYVRLRQKMLGVEQLHMYDVYTPLVASEHAPIPFEDAMDIVSKGLKPMGDAYGELLNMGMHSGWIDIYENKGKRTGAYSGCDYAHHP